VTTLAYIGNFVPEHSTENHVRQAWINQGHTVIRVQEGDHHEAESLIKNMTAVDFVLWTRTADLAAKWGVRKQWEILARARQLGRPTVGFHLDRWWGLNREASVWEEPFFRCDYVITADGGHQEQFASVGVNHIWMPPAVSLGETEPGEYQERFASDLAFVGSWQGGYHAEWTHRPQLITWLHQTYRNQIKFWPRQGEPGIRGKDLRDLYASVKIIIGDSCLVGGATHYWSDRIPETLGRGGFLIHPYVEGIEEQFGPNGECLITWPIGDWTRLKQHIDHYLNAPLVASRIIADRGREHVIAHHTYDVRVNQILEVLGK
jgi:hypothetical protein